MKEPVGKRRNVELKVGQNGVMASKQWPAWAHLCRQLKLGYTDYLSHVTELSGLHVLHRECHSR